MTYLNLEVSILDSAKFLRSEPVQQATWLKLLRYCAGQENGGVIEDAETWTDRDWQTLVRVTLEEVRRECQLWCWNGSELRVEFYPAEHEIACKARRRGAKVTNSKRHRRDGERDGDRDGERDGDRDADRDANKRQGNETEAKKSSLSLSTLVPTLEEVLQWGRANQISDDWIENKYAITTGKNGWFSNGKLIDWRVLWSLWAKKDGAIGIEPKKSPATGDFDTNKFFHPNE